MGGVALLLCTPESPELFALGSCMVPPQRSRFSALLRCRIVSRYRAAVRQHNGAHYELNLAYNAATEAAGRTNG